MKNEKMTVKTVDDLPFWPKRKQNVPFYRYECAESKNMYFNVVLNFCFHKMTKKDELAFLTKNNGQKRLYEKEKTVFW